MSGCYGRCSSCLAASIIDATTHSTCRFHDGSSLFRGYRTRRSVEYYPIISLTQGYHYERS